MWLLASNIKDMTFEERMAIFQPILYLLPLCVVCILGFIVYKIVYKIWRKTALKRLFRYMDAEGEREEAKREYLKDFLTKTSWQELKKHRRTCPLCRETYPLKVQTKNSRGDLVEEWVGDRCPQCNLKIRYSEEESYRKYFILERTPSQNPKEKEYQEAFERLSALNDYYQPYVDCTPDSSDSDINVTVTIR